MVHPHFDLNSHIMTVLPDRSWRSALVQNAYALNSQCSVCWSFSWRGSIVVRILGIPPRTLIARALKELLPAIEEQACGAKPLNHRHVVTHKKDRSAVLGHGIHFS